MPRTYIILKHWVERAKYYALCGLRLPFRRVFDGFDGFFGCGVFSADCQICVWKKNVVNKWNGSDIGTNGGVGNFTKNSLFCNWVSTQNPTSFFTKNPMNNSCMCTFFVREFRLYWINIFLEKQFRGLLFKRSNRSSKYYEYNTYGHQSYYRNLVNDEFRNSDAEKK